MNPLTACRRSIDNIPIAMTVVLACYVVSQMILLLTFTRSADPFMCEQILYACLIFPSSAVTASVQGCTEFMSFVTKIENCATSSSLVLSRHFPTIVVPQLALFLFVKEINMTTNSVQFYQSVFMYLFILQSSFTE